MKIGINLIALPSEKSSGAFRYIQMLMRVLKEYKLQNCEFVIYKQKHISESYIGFPSSDYVHYVNVPSLGSGLKRILFEQTLFYRYLEKCDVLYSYCTSMPLFAKSKKVFTLHDVYYLTTRQRYGWLQRTYLKLITKIYCRVCDRVITVSQFSYNEIIKYLGLKPNKLALTYNFVLQDHKQNVVRPEFLKDVNGDCVNLEVPYFFYIGNLQPGKNIKGMIDGFIEYSQNNDAVQLIIAGKPTTYGDEMIRLVHGHKNIHYVGYLKREYVEWLLANCIAVVLLSFCEGFGIPPIEGFGYGRPCLASNATSLPEVVGDAGCLVDPFDVTCIANGYKNIENNLEDYIAHIPQQLQKFDPWTSTETFMNVLGITDYKRI